MSKCVSAQHCNITFDFLLIFRFHRDFTLRAPPEKIKNQMKVNNCDIPHGSGNFLLPSEMTNVSRKENQFVKTAGDKTSGISPPLSISF